MNAKITLHGFDPSKVDLNGIVEDIVKFNQAEEAPVKLTAIVIELEEGKETHVDISNIEVVKENPVATANAINQEENRKLKEKENPSLSKKEKIKQKKKKNQ